MTGFINADKLAEWAQARWARLPREPLGSFAIDTRQLRPGQIFVALKTEKRDGHDYLAAAKASGASAALVARADESIDLPQLVVVSGDKRESLGADTLRAFQRIAQKYREQFQAAGGKVIGITGSVGKTSTKNLLAVLLGAQSGQGERVLATEGNLNNHLGVPLTLTRLDLAKHRFAVVEAGISGPGEMAPLAQMIGPDVAIITAVAPAHLAALGDLEGVAREKAVLAANTRAGGVAIFPESLRSTSAFENLPTQRISSESFEGFSSEFALPKLSTGMTQNARLAIKAALYLGIAPAQIQARLDTWLPAPLRGQTLSESDGRFIYLDCYNANPASMADALDAFYAQAPEGLPRVLVLGGMEELGERSAMFHRALGRSLRLRPQDRAYAIGEEAEALRTGALEGGQISPEQITVVETLDSLRAKLAEFRGALFLKGSRRYRLETLVEGTDSVAGKPSREVTANNPSGTSSLNFALKADDDAPSMETDTVRRRIQRVIDASKLPRGLTPTKETYGKVTGWVADAVSEHLGINAHDYHHSVDSDALRHIEKNHGKGMSEHARGQIPITDSDIHRLPQIVADPDEIWLGGKTHRGEYAVVNMRRIPDGTTIYVEEVHNKRKEFAAKTLWKGNPAGEDGSEISHALPPYAQSGSGDKLTVVKRPTAVKALGDCSAADRRGSIKSQPNAHASC